MKLVRSKHGARSTDVNGKWSLGEIEMDMDMELGKNKGVYGKLVGDTHTLQKRT